MKKDKEISYKQAIKNNLYILKLAYEISRVRVILDFAFSIVNGLVHYTYSVIFTAIVFGTIENEGNFMQVVIFIVCFMVFMCILHLLSAWYNNSFKPRTDILFVEKINLQIFEKVYDMELSRYENSDFFNKYTRAGAEANERIIKVLANMSQLAGGIVSSVLIISTIFYLDKFAFVFVIFPVLGTFLFQAQQNKARFRLSQENTEPMRRKDYSNRTVYLEEFAKEMRLTDIFGVMQNNYNAAVDDMCVNYGTYGKEIAKYRALYDTILRILSWPLVVLYSAIQVLVLHNLRISLFVVLINAISNLMHSVRSVIDVIAGMQSDGLYIQNLRDFFSYQPKIAQSQDGLIPESPALLEFKNVSFTYEGADQPAIEDISLSLRHGEKIAIVGHNGAGKSTLIKLILRLYDTMEGEIRLDNENIKKYSVMKYRELFGTVFQDYKQLAMSIANNVLMRRTTPEDEPEVKEALKKAGIYGKILQEDKGINAILTREFDEQGLVLSGGELQKLAIAKVFANPAPFAILDEPSSALDPIAEYEMFDNIKNACEDKGVIFISHRLSSVVLANRIYMLEKGRIIESGTHKELMELDGKYASMFAHQAQMYALEGSIANE
jgi:ATP-binding cassette subfamily B protein